MSVSVPVARRVKAPVSDVWVKKVVVAALREAKAKDASEVGVVFVSDLEMKKLNAKHRRQPKTTDVLSFADGERGLLGDIVISVAQAERQARAAKKLLRSELALLLAHGVLHLLGYDHEKVADERVMFALQGRILKAEGYA